MSPPSRVDEFDRVIKELADYLEHAKAVRQKIVEAEARLERRVAERRTTTRGGRRSSDTSKP
jgi:hypothetical protein